MNTRKDYWRAVRIIRDIAPDVVLHSDLRGVLVPAFVEFFRQDNPRFEENRFLDAVEILSPSVRLEPDGRVI